MDKTDETKTYLRGFLPRAVFTKLKCLHWYRHNDTGALRTALRKAGLDDERMNDYYYGEADGVGRLTEWCCEMAERITGRAFSAWGEVAAEIDGRVERDIEAIREAA